jgi:hypothetical protein
MTGNDYYQHNGGHCHDECPVCELDRLASLRGPSTVQPAAYFIGPDADSEPALYRIGDDVDAPTVVVRRDAFADRAAWELLEVGVNIAQAMAAADD